MTERMPDHDGTHDGELPDPTQMRNQPALRTSSGLIWVIVGGLLVVVCLAVLLPLIGLQPGISWFGAITCVVLYIALVAVRISVPPSRTRLVTMAALFGAITLIALVCVLMISALEWAPLRA